MSLTQQWILVGLIFWIASVWYAYALAYLRGRNAGWRESRILYDQLRSDA